MRNGKKTENGKRKTENARRILGRSPFSAGKSLTFSLFSILVCFFLAACASLEKPKPEPFYSDAAPMSARQQKEFRWSNGGKLPASFDPAFAAAAPETDVVRALYKGLTDTDARTLKTVPAIAVDWSSADDDRTWTFKLRGDARWSNGEPVGAADFVRSWKRLAAFGTRVPHCNLLSNIVGMQTAKKDAGADASKSTELNLFPQKDSSGNLSPPVFKSGESAAENKPEISRRLEAERQTDARGDLATQTDDDREETGDGKPTATPPVKNQTALGAVAVDDFTLKVSLVKPDKDFPALVAHPVFRPVFGDGKALEIGKLNRDIVTNGAFRVSGASEQNGLTLERSENFWNRNQIQIERVRFVPSENAEKALEAYRAGEIDALTNADFEPLALKLLTPFDDFRRTTHGALNFYEFNRARAPFNDRRVREALTIAVERERLTEDELDGASFPARGFLPFETEKNVGLSQSAERAKNLFAAAGFPRGENFPVVRLLVNRNNVQQRIARAVAKMWKQHLNVETEIVVKEQKEIEAAIDAGEFDIVRRGAVLPTTDEAMNMLAIFGGGNQVQKTLAENRPPNAAAKEDKITGDAKLQTDASLTAQNAGGAAEKQRRNDSEQAAPDDAANATREITTEADALAEFAAIPLYFPVSYSLVKPYVRGFETNALAAPSLENVRIDYDWQPK